MLTLMILFAFLVWNVIYASVVLVTGAKAASGSSYTDSPIVIENQYAIINDMQVSAIQNTDPVGIVIITQNQIRVSETLIISAFFINLIIATNVTDFNLFPSQGKLNQSTRQKIYEIIEQNEGIHLREICRLLDKKMGVVQYHLYVLENANLISALRDGRYKRFFVNNAQRTTMDEKVVISFLQRGTTSKILDLIFQHNGHGISHGDIAKEMGSSSQAVSWHVHKLRDAGIITYTKKGSQKIYQISQTYIPILQTLLEKA